MLLHFLDIALQVRVVQLGHRFVHRDFIVIVAVGLFELVVFLVELVDVVE